jgi:hypothetical protein
MRNMEAEMPAIKPVLATRRRKRLILRRGWGQQFPV